MVKKDALELIVRQSVEIGITDLKMLNQAGLKTTKLMNHALSKSSHRQWSSPIFLID